MGTNRCETDWDEPLMAEYLRKHIVDISETITAAWQSAFGCVPLGFTTYAANCIEASWRALKALLDPSIQWSNCGTLMIEVALVITSKFDSGDYKEFFEHREAIWPCLMKWQGNVVSGRKDAGADKPYELRGTQATRQATGKPPPPARQAQPGNPRAGPRGKQPPP